MNVLVLAACLLAQTPAPLDRAREVEAREGEPPAQPGSAERGSALDYLHRQYRDDAAKYLFHADAERKQPLMLVEKPVLKWANDDDWSGDVFVWTHAGRPAVIGCMLSGPSGEANRNAYHEFHLLAEQPIAPAGLLTRRNWEPEGGLARTPLPDAPPPANSAAGRLVQMRQISRDFTAHMQADGMWELRLLPQPLFRFESDKIFAAAADKTDAIDGALFAWVWTKGTDPEVLLLVECRRTEGGPAWQYAPVRFSNRTVWLTRGDKEVWRVESHREPAGQSTSLIYTTAYARTFPREAVTKEP
ncbi:MAG TPA: hypothetical protein VFV87_12405 [Pirellulaceae bacterium]|nr:hypothetical protein [Pirellulaceae bacterium]